MRSNLSASILTACLGASALAAPLPPAPAGVEVSFHQGIEFVTIGAAGNAGYPLSTVDYTGLQNERQGRGQVNYAYRLARTEVTTGQWLEFLNTFAPRPQPPRISSLLGNGRSLVGGPIWWGAVSIDYDPVANTERYALRSDLPDADRAPVWSMSRRLAAMYCNWLHNDKRSDWDALLTGAYDTAHWRREPNGNYTDDIEHLPGARFWIPSLDEWGKAAYYDPNRYGPGQEGWWTRAHGRDTLPTPGFPGDEGADTTLSLPFGPLFDYRSLVPLGAFPQAQSPWGLFNTVDGAQEMVSERIDPLSLPQNTLFTLGGYSGNPTFEPSVAPTLLDFASRAFFSGTSSFQSDFDLVSVRIAAAIPTPAASVLLLIGLPIMIQRRRSLL